VQSDSFFNFFSPPSREYCKFPKRLDKIGIWPNFVNCCYNWKVVEELWYSFMCEWNINVLGCEYMSRILTLQRLKAQMVYDLEKSYFADCIPAKNIAINLRWRIYWCIILFNYLFQLQKMKKW
jgi:hypothetical protein